MRIMQTMWKPFRAWKETMHVNQSELSYQIKKWSQSKQPLNTEEKEINMFRYHMKRTSLIVDFSYIVSVYKDLKPSELYAYHIIMM